MRQRPGKGEPKPEEAKDSKKNGEPQGQEAEVLETSTAGGLENGGAVIAATVVFAVYLQTMYPQVPGGDSGELIVAGCTTGIAHPPGYPLFTMLAVLFHDSIPYGSPAWRVNLLSVCLATGCAFFVFKSVFRLDYAVSESKKGSETSGLAFWLWPTSVWAAMMAALMMAFCPLIWMYSIQAEVFAMNNFFVALLLYLTVVYYQERRVSTAYWGAFTIGLGLCNQHTLIFYALPLVLCILGVGWRELLVPHRFLIMVICGLVGLTPYIYLPLAGKKAAFGAWGEVDTVDGFLTHFLRKEYGTFRLYSGNENSQFGDQLTEALWLYGKYLVTEHTLYVGTLLMLIGVISQLLECAKKKTVGTVGFTMILIYSFYMLLFHSLSNLPLDKPLYFGVHMRFWMQANIVAFCWLGVGAGACFRLIPIALQRPVALLVSIALAGLQGGLHYRKMDQHDNTYVYDYGKMHLKKLPKNSILVIKGDVITNSIRYLQRCEGLRPDVQHLDQSMMTYPWFKKKQSRHFKHIKFPNEVYNPYTENGYSMATFLEKNAMSTKRPTFLCGGWYHDEIPAQHGGGIPGFKTWPVGPCDRIRPSHVQMNLTSWTKEANSLTPEYEPPSSEKYPDDTWEHVTLTDYWAAKHKLPYHLLTFAMENNDHQEALTQAATMFEDLIKEHPDPPDYFYKNAGIVYGRLRSAGNHCKMMDTFSRFLVKTTEGPQETDQIFNIVKDYLKHIKKLKEHSMKADCPAEVVNMAKKAYRKLKGLKKDTDNF